MKPTIYVVTYHKFNHEEAWQKPLDPRFTQSDHNYVYYLIDESAPHILTGKNILLEKEIDPLLHRAGKDHLAEWSFFLAEEKHAFCSYPFFVTSSRFYQKNDRLKSDLNSEWNRLFSFLDTYGYGLLPSNNIDLNWYDLSWEKKLYTDYKKFFFFPFREKTYELVKELYQISIPEDYRYTADIFCNYIGFRSRKEFLDYISFYKPIIETLYDENFELKVDLSKYVEASGRFRNERPATFITELLSHLFFFKKQKPYFALHYEGYYEIHEKAQSMKQLYSL